MSCSIRCEYLQGDYNGNCKDFLHTEFMYFTNFSTASTRESTVGSIMTKIDEIIISKRCRSLAYAMVCNTVYAPCNPMTENSPRTICPSACEVFASGECAGLIGPEDEEVYPYISQCDQSGNRGGQLPECLPISLEAPRIGERGRQTVTLFGDMMLYVGVAAIYLPFQMPTFGEDE